MRISNFFIRVIVFLSLISSCEAIPKISTSTTPIASIIAMITDKCFEISVVNISKGCPHHYQMKPSDKNKIYSSQIFIYIDEKFDSYAAHLASNFSGKVIKISDMNSINFYDNNGNKNWHFWLDLNNVLAFQTELTKILISEIPEITKSIYYNMSKAQEKIHLLQRLKECALSSDNNREIIFLSDSLAHFAKDIRRPVITRHHKHHASLKDLYNFAEMLNTDKTQCIVIDSLQNLGMPNKYHKTIVQLDSENWEINDNMHQDISNVFYSKYLHMISQLQTCY